MIVGPALACPPPDQSLSRRKRLRAGAVSAPTCGAASRRSPMEEKPSARRGNATCRAGRCRVEGRTGVLAPPCSAPLLLPLRLSGRWDPLQPLTLSPVVASSSGSSGPEIKPSAQRVLGHKNGMGLKKSFYRNPQCVHEFLRWGPCQGAGCVP